MNNIYKEDRSIVIQKTSILDLASNELVNQVDLEKKKSELLNFDTSKIYDELTKKKIEEHFSYQYPFQNEVSIHSKVTVSELKKLGQTIDEEYSESLFRSEDMSDITKSDEIKPKFISKEQVKSKASRGTLYHKVLVLLDFTKVYNREDLNREMAVMIRQNKLNPDDYKKLKLDYIIRFMESELAGRMRKAELDGKLYKEKQFVIGLNACEVVKDFDSSEIILIQGIIDAFFEEDGELVLLDYKSDIVKSEEQLISRYKVQLDYYRRALEQMLKKKVKEMIIYSLSLGKEIRIV
jgi:ATP-dependent helicase/nuclease subunit A